MKIMSYSYRLLLCASVLLTTNSLKAIEGFSLIPAGSFTMGDSLDGISDAPTRTVTLDAFYMGKYEVTKAEWDEVRTWGLSNGYTDLSAGSGKASNHPVQSITWYDMVKWCNARSQKEGLTPVYYTNDAQTTIYKTGSVNVTNEQVKWAANGYRLPTEAEWEKAARGGLSGKRFPSGDTISHSQANYHASSNYSYDLSGSVDYYHPTYATGSQPYTSPVGAFAANGYGLYDMAGNVWEWCWDWYGTYAAGSQTNPHGSSSGTNRVGRGGGWGNYASCRVAGRSYSDSAFSDDAVGFRVARSATDFAIPPSSLVGKVMVGYWDEPGSGVEFHFFKNENELFFKDSEEHSVNEYAWDPETGILNDYSFGEYFEISFETPDSGTFALYAENEPPSFGTFDIYDGSWDLDGDGIPDGKEVEDGTLPNLSTPPDLESYQTTTEGFSLVPAGTFTMGNSVVEDTDITNAPIREVTLDAYYMGKYEVTKVEWDEVRNWGSSNGYTDLAEGSGKAGNHPVHSISWYDMVKWCNARSEKLGLIPVYYTDDAQTQIYKTGNVDVTNRQADWNANGYRLPTEAEWEKAARGGLSGKRFPWGDTISHTQANYHASSDYSYDLSGNSYHHPSYKTGAEPYTSPTGSFAANGYGLHDISGNLFERCWDWYGDYAPGNQTNPRGATSGAARVHRGGDWDDVASRSRVANRDYDSLLLSHYTGFRLARGVAKESKITGVVTGPDGITRLDGINVTVYQDRDNDEYWDYVSWAVTDANGEYSIGGLSQGAYRVKFEDINGVYGIKCYGGASAINSSDDINLLQSSTFTGVNASLSRASTISGVVMDSDGLPLDGISVSIHQYDINDEWWYWVSEVSTDEFGEYSLGGIGAGTYRIEFRDYAEDHATESYLNAPDLESGRDIVVSEANEIKHINALLDKASSISGKVTGLNGVALTNVEIDLERLGDDGDWRWHAYAETDENGEYYLGGLQPGAYRMVFQDETGQYALEYYDSAVEFDLAKNINLGYEQKVSIDASLVLGSRITGKVTGPDGNPLANVWVDAIRLNSKGKWEWCADAKANADGTYQIGGLPNGTYRVAFSDHNNFYAAQFHGNGDTTMYLELAKDFVINAPQMVSEVNGQFSQRASTIAGIVTDANGSPLHNVRIEAYRKDGLGVWRLVSFVGDLETGDIGSFDAEMLPSGTYRFKFEKGGYITKYYGNSPTLESAADIVVADSGYVDGINVIMDIDLLDSDGDGLSNYVEVVTYGSNPNLADSNGDGLRDGLVVALGKDPMENVSGFVSAIMTNRTELGLHTTEDITDMRVGSMMIERAAGTNKLQFRMKFQKSNDLQNWQDDGEAIFEAPYTPSPTRRFYRFGLK